MAFDEDPSAAHSDPVDDTEPMPFQLASLTMSGYDELKGFILPTFLSSPHLSDIRLAFEDSGIANSVIHSSFPLIASRLQRLSLGFCTSALLPLLQHVVNIREISTQWEELGTVISALAAGVRLQHLEVFIRPWYPRALRTVLLHDLEAALKNDRLRGCRSLRISGYRVKDWMKAEGRRFIALCETRGTKVLK